jgi:hypothetical protein
MHFFVEFFITGDGSVLALIKLGRIRTARLRKLLTDQSVCVPFGAALAFCKKHKIGRETVHPIVDRSLWTEHPGKLLLFKCDFGVQLPLKGDFDQMVVLGPYVRRGQRSWPGDDPLHDRGLALHLIEISQTIAPGAHGAGARPSRLARSAQTEGTSQHHLAAAPGQSP